MELLTTILVAFFFFIMGAFVVGIVWYMQGVAKKSGIDSRTGLPGSTNVAELTRLLRDMQTQELVVEIDGKSFTTANELSPAQQRRLSFTSNVLVKWLADATPAPSVVEAPVTAPTEAGTPDIIAVAAESATLEPSPVIVPPFAPEMEQEVMPVSTDLPDVVGGLLNPVPQPQPVFKSIAMQINDVLQAKIAGTDLESRGLTLNDAPNHGVMVALDGKKYDGIMEVPDEAVRKVIRLAVQEWETKK